MIRDKGMIKMNKTGAERWMHEELVAKDKG